MLLNILRCTRQGPTAKNHPAQNASIAEAEKPWPKALDSLDSGVFARLAASLPHSVRHLLRLHTSRTPPRSHF